MSLTIPQRAQRYLDFGYASDFKERHWIGTWFRLGRYSAARRDSESRWVDTRWRKGGRIRRPGFSVPNDHWQPLLPRWAHR